MTGRSRGGRPPRVGGRQTPVATSLIEQEEEDPVGAGELAAARLAMSVRDGLAAALERSGSDRSALARTLGLSLSAVCQAIDGDGNLRVSTIARYARALGYQASLRLDPISETVPELNLALPANIVRRAASDHWQVLKLETGKVWAAETEGVEFTPSRMVFKTSFTSLQATGQSGSATTSRSDMPPTWIPA
jgi:hypothetical protein